jgi:hypothetical protein
MKLKKTIFGRRGGSAKFRLPCGEHMKDDKEWLSIKRYLTTKEYNVLIGSIQHSKEVIVKFDEIAAIEHEYRIANVIFEHRIPNFIKFLCSFNCVDNIESIKERDFSIQGYLCTGVGKPLGVMVMSYYPLGSLNGYRWDRGNFQILKNVLQQAIFALLYAFETFGFVHGDLHAGNVLLRASKKKHVQYGARELPTMGLYPLIMDFDRSIMDKNATTWVYRDIDRLLSVTRNMDNSDLAIEYDTQLLTRYISTQTPIDNDVYASLYAMVENASIRYVVSELPKRPW